MISDTNMRACTWLAAAVIAALPGMGNASEVSPEELATLAMRLILQQDDESIVRFHSLMTGSTEEEVRNEYLSEYRDGLDGVMAAAVEDAQGGRVLYKVLTEAQHRVQCAPVLPSPPVELDANGTELAVVRMRCTIPEIRHIEAGEPADASQGDLIPETNRSWKSYLEDLRQPATVPIPLHMGPATRSRQRHSRLDALPLRLRSQHDDGCPGPIAPVAAWRNGQLHQFHGGRCCGG